MNTLIDTKTAFVTPERCDQAPHSFWNGSRPRPGNSTRSCFPVVNVDFYPRLFRDNGVWALCPNGYFLRGIYVEETNPSSGYSFDAMHLLVEDITQGQCCRPKHHPSEWDSCYEENIWFPFDRVGWVSCREGYFIAGFYKNQCDNLYCIETLKCCSMKTIQG